MIIKNNFPFAGPTPHLRLLETLSATSRIRRYFIFRTFSFIFFDIFSALVDSDPFYIHNNSLSIIGDLEPISLFFFFTSVLRGNFLWRCCIELFPSVIFLMRINSFLTFKLLNWQNMIKATKNRQINEACINSQRIIECVLRDRKSI